MKILKNSLNAFFRNPEIIFIFLILYAVLYLFSFVKMPTSNSALTDYIYLIIPNLIILLIYSFFLSLVIGASYLALKNKFSFQESVKYLKYTFINFLFLLPVPIIYFFTSYIFKLISNPIIATILNELIFIIISALALIFVMKKTIKSKFKLKNYFLTTIILIIYYPLTFIVDSFLSLFSGISAQLIYIILYFVIIYPIITLILTSLFENVSSK